MPCFNRPRSQAFVDSTVTCRPSDHDADLLISSIPGSQLPIEQSRDDMPQMGAPLLAQYKKHVRASVMALHMLV